MSDLPRYIIEACRTGCAPERMYAHGCNTDAEALEALKMEASEWDSRYVLMLTNTETGEVLGTTAGTR